MNNEIVLNTTRFEKAWEYLKTNEGGYANDKHDKGGETKFGISLAFLKSIGLEDGDVNGDGKIDGKDIKYISMEAAKTLYKKYFWFPANCEAIKYFDMGVNFGKKAAAKLMQKGVNEIGDMYVDVDGIIGQKSLNAVNKTNPEELLNKLVELCVKRYAKIVVKNPTQRKFLNGWMKRAERVPA